MSRIARSAAVLSALCGLSLPVRVIAQGAGSGCSSDFVAKANGMLKTYLEKSNAPGVAVAFYDNGKSCVLTAGQSDGKAQGPVTGETLFAMGSVQKVFSSTLLAYEMAQGKVGIDDSASKYLAAAGGDRVSSASAFNRITLRSLVTHTAALPNAQPDATEREGWSLYRDKPMPVSTLQYLNAWEPPYAPGTKYSYSNLGHVLVGYVATGVAQKPYSALLSEAVTQPLGMSHTARAICDGPNPQCAEGHGPKGRRLNGQPAGLWTTADDMLRFIEAELGVLKVPDVQTKAIALTHQELWRENSNHALGMAWEEWHSGDNLMLSKNGGDSGFTSWLAFLPKRNRGVCVLSNGAGEPPPAELGTKLLELAQNQSNH
jgi:beta-lactamase class C